MPSMNLVKMEPQAICMDKNTTGPASAKTVKVTNRSSSSSVGFGVKVQASAQKFVRAQPRMGTLKPGETQELTIFLKCQAQVSDKAGSYCIVLQAVKVEESESCTLTKETFEKAPKKLLQQAKFRVTIGDSSVDDVKDEEPSEKDGEDSFDEPQEEEQKPQAPARNGTPSVAASDDAGLQVKYDELLAYKQMLENGREKLQEDEKRIREATSSTVQAQGALKGGWRIEHVVAVVFFVPLIVHSVKSWLALFDV